MNERARHGRLPDWVAYELPLLASMALIWVLSDQPSLPGPGERGSLIRDIFNYGSHAFIYGLVALLAWRVLNHRASRWRHLAVCPRLTATLLALGWGLLDEYHQSFIPGRTASPWDALTDLVGATLAVWAGPLLLRWLDQRRSSHTPASV
ncbi:MAG: VanZ family protein [Anaerolineae bacterium]|jgi:VanZ family protein|nr:VanZ family protein [Chloroflexota bacterium]